ncbi:MAG: ABC transporter ATP-binding protein [Microcoleaceae cyanobacterium]
MTAECIPIVQTHQLSKTYRTGFWLNQKVESLKQCSITVHQGETFGLLGQNGAGKTTLLKILLGITRPSSGSGKLLNQPIGNIAVKQRIGYLPENPYFYDHLTGWEFLEFAAGLFQIPKSIQRQRIPELFDLVGLAKSAALKKPMGQYSKGMLQRVGMAQALINDPEIVFLDEPMSGLDPMGRYQIREIILSLKARNKTIFFNSHVLSDVEKICDRVAILAQGNLLKVGSLDELLGTDETYIIKGKGGEIEQLKQWISNFTIENNIWQGYLNTEPQAFFPKLLETNAQLISIKLSRISLEEFFMQTLEEKGIYQSR